MSLAFGFRRVMLRMKSRAEPVCRMRVKEISYVSVGAHEQTDIK